MRYGSVVKNKATGEYGTCHYSTFGASIHTYDEIENILTKTLGDSMKNVMKQWEACDLPEGYEWNENNIYIRRIR